MERFEIIGISSEPGKSYIPYRNWRIHTRKLIKKFRVESAGFFCPRCKTVPIKNVRRGYGLDHVTERAKYSSYFVRRIGLYKYNLNWETPVTPKPKLVKIFTGVIYLLTPKIDIKNEALIGTQQYEINRDYVMAGKTPQALFGYNDEGRYLVKAHKIVGLKRRETYVPTKFLPVHTV